MNKTASPSEKPCALPVNWAGSNSSMLLGVEEVEERREEEKDVEGMFWVEFTASEGGEVGTE